MLYTKIVDNMTTGCIHLCSCEAVSNSDFQIVRIHGQHTAIHTTLSQRFGCTELA